MQELGHLVRLQIQRSTLKVGEKPNRVYDPAPLLSVPRLAVTPDGVLGAGPEGSWVLDVHHRAHPFSKNEDGLHGVSVGLTGHYAAMRERFGPRITLGCAGENLIAERAGLLPLAEITGGLAVVGADGRERLRLRVLQVAEPCRPFTGWAIGGNTVEADVLKSHLQFLQDGMRGFYLQAEGSGVVEVGDLLVAI
jgi:hypothetical protein